MSDCSSILTFVIYITSNFNCCWLCQPIRHNQSLCDPQNVSEGCQGFEKVYMDSVP